MSARAIAGIIAIVALLVRPVACRADESDPPRFDIPSAAAPPSTPAAAGEQLDQLLQTNLTPIDLESALRLAGEQNSQILLAQQRVVEAIAVRQLATAQFLPTLNGGTNYNAHQGPLQQSQGTILNVDRSSLYVGAGAFAVGAGTVTIPGLVWTGNLSQAIYGYLVVRQEVHRLEFASQVVRQDRLLEAALAYLDLVRAEGQESVAEQVRNDAREVARLTAAYLKAGLGRNADADRAATEFARREAIVIQMKGRIEVASAHLAEVLHLEPTQRLHAIDDQILPKSIVPDAIPLPQLIAIALLNRPELKERQVAVRQALNNLDQARLLPFSPTVFLGYSTGTFGGGSDLASAPVGSTPNAVGQDRFGNFNERQDIDLMAYWTLLNLGVGNQALIDTARSRLRSADLQQILVLDRVRSEVASAYARTHARYAQIRTGELAIQSATEGFEEDRRRILGSLGLPLELINSLRLLARSRVEYVDALVDYNSAQFQLYVAIGKPPADLLVRRADENGTDPAVRALPNSVPGQPADAMKPLPPLPNGDAVPPKDTH